MGATIIVRTLETPTVTTATMSPTDYLSSGQVCLALRCLTWHVNQLLARGLLPEPRRIAGRRVWPVEQLPQIRAALERAGYIHPEESDTAEG